MRIICNGFGWFQAAAGEIAAEHDVVQIGPAEMEALWREPSNDWWQDVCPAGWVPDVALFCTPEYVLLPAALSELPCPIALWVGDWYANAQAVHALADQADLILADATGVRALRASGIDHVDECCPWTFDPLLHRPDWDAAPAWDVGFLGNLSDAIQHERNAWLARVADLPGDYRVHAGGGMYGEDYARFMQRTRVTFNRSVTGDVNMRCFEAAACGSLGLIERGNREVARWFEPGREIVEYDEHDFEEVVAHYLTHEDERHAIARAGWERVQQHAPGPRLRALVDRLAQLAEAGVTRTTTAITAASCANTAMQAMTVVGARPWAGMQALLDLAQQSTPDEARIYSLRAVLSAELAAASGDPAHAVPAVQQALANSERALSLDPADAVTLLNRATTIAAAGGHDVAGKLANDLVERLRAGAVRAGADTPVFPLAVSRARIAWQAAILAGGDAEAQLTSLATAAAHRLAGQSTPDPEERIAHLHASLATLDDPDVRLSVAGALRTLGRCDAAIAELETVLTARPLDPDAWMEYVGALVDAGRRDDALEFVDHCRRRVARLAFEDPALIGQLEALARTAAAAQAASAA